MELIEILPLERIRFVKTISFSSSFGLKTIFAKVVYSRKLSPNYKMTSTDKLLDLYFNTKEEVYPNDDIDKFILSAIQNIYPDAKMHTSLIMFNIEEESLLKSLKSLHKDKFEIQANPYVGDIYEALKSGKNSWPIFIKSFDLFTASREIENWFNKLSIVDYNIEKEDEFKKFWSQIESSVLPIEL